MVQCQGLTKQVGPLVLHSALVATVSALGNKDESGFHRHLPSPPQTSPTPLPKTSSPQTKRTTPQCAQPRDLTLLRSCAKRLTCGLNGNPTTKPTRRPKNKTTKNRKKKKTKHPKTTNKKHKKRNRTIRWLNRLLDKFKPSRAVAIQVKLTKHAFDLLQLFAPHLRRAEGGGQEAKTALWPSNRCEAPSKIGDVELICVQQWLDMLILRLEQAPSTIVFGFLSFCKGMNNKGTSV